MLRKQTATFFLAVAYILFLGHNIVPHHHHESGHELTEHHNDHHLHAEKDLSHLLSHFVHATDGFTVTVQHHAINAASPIIAILADSFALDRIIIRHFEISFPPEPLVYISPHEFSFGNKAPPFC